MSGAPSATPIPDIMHVQYVAICDQVIIGSDGRPSLINVFNDVPAPAVPFTIPRLVFVARVLFTDDELGGQRRVEIVITDPGGAEMGRPGGDLQLPQAPPGVDSVAVDIPLPFDMFQVSAFGRYTFLLQIDGAARGAAQLHVRQVTLA